MEYVLLIIGFIGTLLAIFGNTKDEKTKKITLFGYGTLIITIISFFISIYKSYDDKEESIKKAIAFEKMSNQLDSSFKLTEKLNTQIATYEKILSKISKESGRQPQWTMLNYYHLRYGESITLPSKISTGSILRFIGESDKLELEYDTRRIIVPNFDYSRPMEIPVIGRSGLAFTCKITNKGNKESGFKLFILSTTISSSNLESWKEDADNLNVLKK